VELNGFSGVCRCLSSQVVVMILKTSIGLAFAAACLTAIVTTPVRADTARQNVIQSERYDRFLETNELEFARPLRARRLG